MDYFSDSIVQPRIKDFFIHSLNNDRLAHAYIFYGREGRGKEAFALELAKVLNCSSDKHRPCNRCPSCIKINKFNHPDIKYIFPFVKKNEPKISREILQQKARNPYAPIEVSGNLNISIDLIRELKNEAKYAPFEARKRVFILYGAEYFSRQAANSFLKLLEEPPQNVLLILITDNYYALLDTIRSRCQPVYFPEFSETVISELIARYMQTENDLAPLIRISQHNIKKVFRMLHSDYRHQRDLVYRFLKAVATDNYFTISALIDEIGQKRDKNYILELLNLLILWLRDALHYLITEDTRHLINQDYEEPIRKFAEFYRQANFDLVIGLVENTYLHIKQNAHPALALTNLAVEMHKLLISPKSLKEAV